MKMKKEIAKGDILKKLAKIIPDDMDLDKAMKSYRKLQQLENLGLWLLW